RLDHDRGRGVHTQLGHDPLEPHSRSLWKPLPYGRGSDRSVSTKGMGAQRGGTYRNYRQQDVSFHYNGPYELYSAAPTMKRVITAVDIPTAGDLRVPI